MSSQKYKGYFTYTIIGEKNPKCYNFKGLNEIQVLNLHKNFNDKSRFIYHGHKVNKE